MPWRFPVDRLELVVTVSSSPSSIEGGGFGSLPSASAFSCKANRNRLIYPEEIVKSLQYHGSMHQLEFCI